MRWAKIYQERKRDIHEAVSVIKSGQRVYLSANASAPYALMRALAERKNELENVELVNMLLLGKDPLCTPEMKGHFFHSSLFVGSADREAVNAGRSAYIPVHLHQIPTLLRDNYLPLDVAMIHVSPPDEHGFVSLGTEVVAAKAAVEVAKHVIGQVNPKMPRTLGNSFVHVSQFASLVEVDEPLFTLDIEPFTDVEYKIGQHITSLIKDGDTLQLGIGGIPNAVLTLLEGRRDIGIHTEMISDGIVAAVEKGIITGLKKVFHPGKVIGTFVLGSEELYSLVNNNPLFELHPVDYTNDPFVVAKNDNMVAINSAIEVDLTGQVCSDSMGTYIYSGFGGQLDFIRGAAHAKNGRPVIALPATAKKGKLSRIVPTLQTGAGVVTTRADVRYVVTEFGVASLFGKNLQQRAKELIKVAHPDFRDMLTEEAKKRNFM